ncbi:hypothetical protein [Methylocystis parvus]|uniref:Uncharacterized protein n=1 Tax=Methylocystis parvus TaxID=134 RepID=A0A6B8M1P1_9HYPH|nr:hypothetical protein [Methylocystis parvus]QGM96258.1 hypothetical protein F7D14_01345 [Methylocystis parvus]WBJ99904.1 hypothetical protein MMG94_18270 [Methylocystis parvus OBBP]
MKKVSPSNFGGEGGNVKLSRKPRKSRSTFYSEPEHAPTFEPKANDWIEIERGYGHELPQALRDQIKDIVDDYLWFFHCDRNKSYASDAIAYLEKITRAPFPTAALAKTPRNPAHKAARDVLLQCYLFGDALLDDECGLANFLETPEKIISASNALLANMTVHDMAPNRKKPVEWDKMVVRLILALRSYGLPYTVNKRGTLEGASPVVSLLHGIQDQVPAECRLHIGRDGEATDETMAAAASAAWVAYKASSEGRHTLREQAKLERARSEGGDYEILGRAERFNRVMKYIRNRQHKRLARTSAVANAPKTPS